MTDREKIIPIQWTNTFFFLFLFFSCPFPWVRWFQSFLSHLALAFFFFFFFFHTFFFPQGVELSFFCFFPLFWGRRILFFLFWAFFFFPFFWGAAFCFSCFGLLFLVSFFRGAGLHFLSLLPSPEQAVRNRFLIVFSRLLDRLFDSRGPNS